MVRAFVPNSVLRFGSGPDFQGTNCRIQFGGFRGGSVDSIGRHGQVTRMSSRIAAGRSIIYPSKRGFPQRERQRERQTCFWQLSVIQSAYTFGNIRECGILRTLSSVESSGAVFLALKRVIGRG